MNPLFQTQATFWVGHLWTQQGASEIRVNKPFRGQTKKKRIKQRTFCQAKNNPQCILGSNIFKSLTSKICIIYINYKILGDPQIYQVQITQFETH